MTNFVVWALFFAPHPTPATITRHVPANETEALIQGAIVTAIILGIIGGGLLLVVFKEPK